MCNFLWQWTSRGNIRRARRMWSESDSTQGFLSLPEGEFVFSALLPWAVRPGSPQSCFAAIPHVNTAKIKWSRSNTVTTTEIKTPWDATLLIGSNSSWGKVTTGRPSVSLRSPDVMSAVVTVICVLCQQWWRYLCGTRMTGDVDSQQKHHWKMTLKCKGQTKSAYLNVAYRVSFLCVESEYVWSILKEFSDSLTVFTTPHLSVRTRDANSPSANLCLSLYNLYREHGACGSLQ